MACSTAVVVKPDMDNRWSGCVRRKVQKEQVQVCFLGDPADHKEVMKEFYDGSTCYQLSLLPSDNDKDKDILNVDMVRKDDGARCAGLQAADSKPTSGGVQQQPSSATWAAWRIFKAPALQDVKAADEPRTGQLTSKLERSPGDDRPEADDFQIVIVRKPLSVYAREFIENGKRFPQDHPGLVAALLWTWYICLFVGEQGTMIMWLRSEIAQGGLWCKLALLVGIMNMSLAIAACFGEVGCLLMMFIFLVDALLPISTACSAVVLIRNEESFTLINVGLYYLSATVWQSLRDEKREADHGPRLRTSLWLLHVARIVSMMVTLASTCFYAACFGYALWPVLANWIFPPSWLNRMPEAPSLYALIEPHSDVLLHQLGVMCGLLRVGTQDVLKDDGLKLLLGRARVERVGAAMATLATVSTLWKYSGWILFLIDCIKRATPRRPHAAAISTLRKYGIVLLPALQFFWLSPDDLLRIMALLAVALATPILYHHEWKMIETNPDQRVSIFFHFFREGWLPVSRPKLNVLAKSAKFVRDTTQPLLDIAARVQDFW